MNSIIKISKVLLSKTVSGNNKLLTKPSTNFVMRFISTDRNYENIKVERVGAKKNVGLITLHRPAALNALSQPLLTELDRAASEYDSDDTIGAIVITGSDKAFAAGADIVEMKEKSYVTIQSEVESANIGCISKCGKPIIAAVNGFALGGGCELAMICDIIYAGEKAKFGQPEIKIGIIPGAGGTQRLPRFVGKSKGMELVLGGDFVSAHEAEKMGLVSRVFPVEKVLEEAIKLAEKISSHSPLTVKIAKQAVNQAFETHLNAGILFEKSLFYGTFATADQKEGMAAFVEKRAPKFRNE